MSYINESFGFINQSKISFEDNKIKLFAPAGADIMNSAISGAPKNTVPFYYKNISGDFKISVKVTPQFLTTYESGSILLFENDEKWVKYEFEKTQNDEPRVASAITEIVTDIANGQLITEPSVIMQIIRKDSSMVFHYSVDGENFKLHRIAPCKLSDDLKVGICVQCPIGEGSWVEFEDLIIDENVPEDIKNGK